MLGLEEYLDQRGLEESFLHLVKLRTEAGTCRPPENKRRRAPDQFAEKTLAGIASAMPRSLPAF
jgi:hypothetical protein